MIVRWKMFLNFSHFLYLTLINIILVALGNYVILLLYQVAWDKQVMQYLNFILINVIPYRIHLFNHQS